MKFINILTLVLVIVGGLNWGLVGLSAAWQIVPLFAAIGSGELVAERGR